MEEKRAARGRAHQSHVHLVAVEIGNPETLCSTLSPADPVQH